MRTKVNEPLTFTRTIDAYCSSKVALQTPRTSLPKPNDIFPRGNKIKREYVNRSLPLNIMETLFNIPSHWRPLTKFQPFPDHPRRKYQKNTYVRVSRLSGNGRLNSILSGLCFSIQDSIVESVDSLGTPANSIPSAPPNPCNHSIESAVSLTFRLTARKSETLRNKNYPRYRDPSASSKGDEKSVPLLPG